MWEKEGGVTGHGSVWTTHARSIEVPKCAYPETWDSHTHYVVSKRFRVILTPRHKNRLIRKSQRIITKRVRDRERKGEWKRETQLYICKRASPWLMIWPRQTHKHKKIIVAVHKNNIPKCMFNIHGNEPGQGQEQGQGHWQSIREPH